MSFIKNIKGLRGKSDELMHYLEILNTNSHVVCISEHHITGQDPLSLSLLAYVIG